MGSSRMMSFALPHRALAISSSCFWLVLRRPTISAGSISTPHAVKQGGGFPVYPLFIDASPSVHRFPGEEEVFRHRQVVEKVQFLVHEGDARGLGFLHRHKF